MQRSTKELTTSGLLCALAYILMLVSKLIPEVAGFLQFDLKDIIIVMGGFILGPAYALIISVVVALIEMITVSNTGIIGLIMNIVSTVAFCCTASLIYSKFRTFKGAIAGLVSGTMVLTLVMVLWNVYVTPIYMKVPKEVVISMLSTVFIPFNVLKGLINSAITLIMYRTVVKSLSKAGLVEYSSSANTKSKSYLSLAIGLSILAVCIPVFLHLLKII